MAACTNISTCPTARGLDPSTLARAPYDVIFPGNYASDSNVLEDCRYVQVAASTDCAIYWLNQKNCQIATVSQ